MGLHHPQVGARHGRALGQRRIMATVKVIALEDMLGKKPQLPHGAPALTLQPRLGQAGFLAADKGDRLGAGLDLVGDGVEKRCAILAAAIAEGPERLFCRKTGRVNECGRANAEFMGRPVRGLGLKACLASNPIARDQVLAMGGECLVEHVVLLFRSGPWRP
jgi:hypothetical protein